MLKHLACAVAMLAAAPAFAATKTFTAKLSGDVETSKTGSKATGTALFTVDTESKTVSVTMDFTGLKIADLEDGLVARPMGPIHLHNYLANGDVVLVLPTPFGAGYADTAKGFSVTMKGYSYADGAKLLKSDLSFEGFLAAMASGTVVLNVHTDRFGQGEISGQVVSAAN
jgi:CHRD domain-containing protein